jgi:putative ABC transport system permease protein
VTDLGFALRAFTRNLGATCLIVLTLGVAIATGTVIAGLIDVVWRFIPVVRSDQLVFVASTDPRPEQSQAGVSSGLARTGVSIPDLVDWSERTNTFREFAAFTFRTASLTGSDVPLRIVTVRSTRNLLDVWGIVPRIGRTFTVEEARAGGKRVAIVSDAFWQRQLSATRDAIGRTLMLDGEAHTVIGVLPADAGRGLFRDADVLTPIVLDRERARRDERRLFVTAVLKPATTLEQAEADLDAVARQLQAEYPLTNAKTGVVVRPLIEMIGGNISVVIFLLGLIAVLVVCIACANISSIILARSTIRRRELAVRAALGASRFHQIRQLMLESVVTSTAAGVVGLTLAWWSVLAIRFVGGDLEGFSEMSLNGRVVAIGVALTFLAPFGFALLPAVRMSKPDMDELRQGNRGTETTRGRRLRESLVVAQVALALILMIQVGLIGRTTWRLHNLEKGFDPAQVLTLRMDLPEADYRELGTVRDFFTRALDRIQVLPGVTAAGTVTPLPIADREMDVRFTIQGMPQLPPASQPRTARFAVSADYLRTMRIPLIRGRGLVRADFGNAPPVALVNQEMARTYWPNQNPIGKRIDVSGDSAEWIEVVGVVGNVRTSNASFAAAPQLYQPSSWRPDRSVAFVVRSSGSDPTKLAPAIRRELAQLDKNVPVYEVQSMERVLIADLGGTYLLTGVLAVTAIVALFLAAAGVYGLMSFSVSQRTREIGLRMALGAKPAEILTMIVARGSLPMTIGLVVGSVGAAMLVSMTARAIEEIDLRDPLAYIFVSVPLIVIALLATCIPARRATHVDPMLALRAD